MRVTDVALIYLQGSKHQHFLVCAVNFFVQQLPFGLLVYLIYSYGVVLGIQVVEAREFEFKAQYIELLDTLFHYGQ